MVVDTIGDDTKYRVVCRDCGILETDFESIEAAYPLILEHHPDVHPYNHRIAVQPTEGGEYPDYVPGQTGYPRDSD